MQRMTGGLRHTADAQVGGGAGLDDGAKFDQAVEDEVLAAADLFEPFPSVGAPHPGCGGSLPQGGPLALQCRSVDVHTVALQRIAVAQVIGDLVDTFAGELLLVSFSPPRQGCFRVEPRAMAWPRREAPISAASWHQRMALSRDLSK